MVVTAFFLSVRSCEKINEAPCPDIDRLLAPLPDVFIKVYICALRVTYFDTIIVLEIFFPPDLANPFPFSGRSMMQVRGSVGS